MTTLGFVKLDCGMLNSSLWVDREAREVFITALLMAKPFDVREPTPTIAIRSLEPMGYLVPPGWYGFVAAAGSGITRAAGVDRETGLAALERLASPDPESRSDAFEGRRLVRVDGGYLVLNYMRYRERDYSAADRMRRLRAARRNPEPVTANERNVTPNRRNKTRKVMPVPPNVTQADTEADTEAEPPLPSAAEESARARADSTSSSSATTERLEVPEDIAQHLTDPEHRAALEGYARRAQFPPAVYATIRAEGPGGAHEQRGATWPHVGRALVEMQAANVSPFSARALRGFLRRALAPETGPPESLDALAERLRREATV